MLLRYRIDRGFMTLLEQRLRRKSIVNMWCFNVFIYEFSGCPSYLSFLKSNEKTMCKVAFSSIVHPRTGLCWFVDEILKFE